MIIEIRDLPVGSKIKTIECKIEFDDSGVITSSSSITDVEQSQEPSLAEEPVFEVEREKNIAPEMENLEF